MHTPTGTLETFTGQKFDLLNPENNYYDRRDIIHALAYTCRYGGHCNRYYSVAEHVYIGTFLTDNRKVQRQFCAHDAPEAFLGDWPTPLKNIPVFNAVYRTLDEKHLEQICTQWFIEQPFEDEVWDIDQRMFCIEQPQLMKGLWYPKKPMSNIKLFCWSPEHAEEALTSRFKELDLL